MTQSIAHNDELSDLAAALAHEIKNPAAIALAHVDQLRKRTDLHGIGDTCDYIEEALEKICYLVQEMLFVTYCTSPAYEFDLEDMFLDMLETYQAAWPQIIFSFNTTGRLIIHGEEVYIKMIFTNLLKNAVEAIGARGAISINLEAHSDGYISVSIQDSGGSHTAHKPHATGLGLAICRWLINRIGGHMELNIHEESGCEAKVLLPI